MSHNSPTVPVSSIRDTPRVIFTLFFIFNLCILHCVFHIECIFYSALSKPFVVRRVLALIYVQKSLPLFEGINLARKLGFFAIDIEYV